MLEIAGGIVLAVVVLFIVIPIIIFISFVTLGSTICLIEELFDLLFGWLDPSCPEYEKTRASYKE